MQAVILHLIQANLILSLLYAAYFLFLSKETSLRFNRLYLMASWFVALLLPFLRIPNMLNETKLPTAQYLLEPMFLSENLPESTEQLSTSWLDSLTWQHGLVCFLLIITFLFLLHLLYRMHQIYRIEKQFGFKLELRPDYYLIFTEGKFPVFSFFKRIFWHEQEHLSKEQNQAILKHELVHVRQKHSVDVVISELFLAFFWYNPLAWQLKKAITDNHEYLADSASSSTLQVNHYKQLLLGQYTKQYNLSLGNFFYQSTIINRIMMLNKLNKKPNVWKIAVCIPLFTILLIGFGCESSMLGSLSDAAEVEPQMSEEEPIFNIVEEQAEPKGGITSFYEYVAGELKDKYPKEALEAGLQGTVFIQFVIEKDGTVSDVVPVKGIGYGCDEAAAEVVASFNDWIPGKQGGNIVRTRRIVPIKFVINEDTFEETDVLANVKKIKISDPDGGEEIFTKVDNMAEPIDGIQSLYNTLSTELSARYPEDAKKMGIEGSVFVQFVVEKDGSLSNAQVVKGIGAGCDELAKEIIENSGQWNPGVHNNKTVRSVRIIPVKFVL